MSSYSAYGLFKLSQSSWGSPVYVAGYMRDMPSTFQFHGFAINKRAFRRDNDRGCASAGPHWNPFSEVHGYFGTIPSHVGQLMPMVTDGASEVNGYIVGASRPTMFGPNSIIGKAMTVY